MAETVGGGVAIRIFPQPCGTCTVIVRLAHLMVSLFSLRLRSCEFIKGGCGTVSCVFHVANCSAVHFPIRQ